MTWRDHAWELAIGVLSWTVAIGALAFVAAYLGFEAVKNRRKGSAR